MIKNAATVERMEYYTEKVCALNAILVSQILLKVRNKEPLYNRSQQYLLTALED
jgi:hypothetical protein